MKHLLHTFLIAFVCLTATVRANSDTLTILHVNDTHSCLAPLGPRTSTLEGTQGGIARAATFIGMMRQTYPNLMLLHAGDLFVGDLFFNKYFGVPELQLMQSLGFDAMAVGNHEFDLTPAILDTALSNAFPSGGFPLVSANTVLEHPDVQHLKTFIKPYTIKQVGNVKVGIFGMTTPATNLLSQPAPAFIDTNIIQIAAAMVDTLQSQDCNVVICLSHLGLDLDKLVAQYVPGIDAIIGGHDHYSFSHALPVVNPAGDTTWIAQAGSQYKNIGMVQLVVDSNQVRLMQSSVVPLDQSIPEEPTVRATVQMLIAGIEQTYGAVYSQRISTVGEFFEEEADSLMFNGYRDTPVGNLVTDAYKAATGAQIAIQPGGSTAQPLYAGPLVPADVFRTVGYGFNTENGLGYHLVTFEMRGAALMAGIEFGLSGIEQNDEFFIQASGLTYTYNARRPPFSRLVDARVGTVPLDPAATYSIATNYLVLLVLSQLQIPFSNPHVFSGDTTEFQVLTAYISQFDTLRPIPRQRILSPVKEITSTPREFRLDQNYPNPFNPATRIVFYLTEKAPTNLIIFNLLGQEVVTLVNSTLDSGQHEIAFNAYNLPSGVYLYRLQSGNLVQSRKMLLMK